MTYFKQYIWKYIYPTISGFIIFITGFLVIPFVPFVCLFIKWDNTLTEMDGLTIPRGDLPWYLNWFSTPDERLPGGMYEPAVKSIYEKYGAYWCSVYWLGIRNRANGFAAAFGTSVDFTWPDGYGYFEDTTKYFWWLRYDLYKQKFTFKLGYRVYTLSNSKIAVPVFTFTKA